LVSKLGASIYKRIGNKFGSFFGCHASVYYNL
jgi:hypothetical protein